MFRQSPGVHARGGGRAHARHRRQHRHLLGGQRGAAQAGAVPRSGPAGDVPEHVAAGVGPRRVAGEVPALAGARHGGPGRLGLPHRRRELHRRRRSPSSCDRGRCRPTSSGCSARRSFAAAPSRPRRICPTRDRVVVLSQRFWESRFNRSDDVIGKPISLERRALHGHRRPRRVRLLRVSVPSPQVWYPFQLAEHRGPGALLPGRRPAQAGRHARPGQDPRRGVRRRVQAQVSERARPERRLQRQPDPRRAGHATSSSRCWCWSARSASCC